METRQTVESCFLSLSAREKDICHLLANGHTVAEIAGEEFGSVHAIHKVIDRARRREGCKTTVRLVVRYLEEYCGVLDPVNMEALKK